MTINLNGPTRLVFDVSELTGTLDRDEELSPLAWQYVVERDIAVLGHVSVVSTLPHCPSLVPQYQLIRSLQVHEGVNILAVLGLEILTHLSAFIISIEMTSQILIITKCKPIARSSI